MLVENTNNTYKFLPSTRVVLGLILGILVFSIPTYLFSTSTVDKGSGLAGQIVYYIILLFFSSMLIMLIYYLLTIKSVCVDNLGLTIKYPILFHSLTIDFNEILDKTISPQIIKSSGRGGTFTVFEGKRILIEYGNNKTIEINSFVTSNFDELCNLLMTKKKSTAGNTNCVKNQINQAIFFE